MKRSEVVNILKGWASKEILTDVYSNNLDHWANELLYVLENELNIINRSRYNDTNPVNENQHGHCPDCNANLDGELVIAYPLNQGKTLEEAIEYASNYAGYTENGLNSRFGRQIGIYDINRDRTTKWKCPDCGHEWS
jgi:hypothetical protein